MVSKYTPEISEAMIRDDREDCIVVYYRKCGGTWREFFRLDTTFKKIEELDEGSGVEAALNAVLTFFETRRNNQFVIQEHIGS